VFKHADEDTRKRANPTLSGNALIYPQVQIG
jgi:hypothetical protein